MNRPFPIAIAIVALAALVLALVLVSMPERSREQTATSTAPTKQIGKPERTTIGRSVEGRAIRAFTYGSGSEHVVFVGGIHGGYEWNSVLLARQLMDHIEAEPSFMPDGLKVTVIPMLNPDGVAKVIGTTTDFTAADAPPKAETERGRFNANGVDLNRNFDCNWESTGIWRGQSVDAGDAVFSEPEARAMRDFTRAEKPDAVIFFHSAAGGVYGATCGGSIGQATERLMRTYADAAGYRAIEKFDHYKVTGDAESWHTKLGIPSVSVELTNHQDVEWRKNKEAIRAVLELYSDTEAQ